MIADDKHWNILISHVLQMKRLDWTNSSNFVTINFKNTTEYIHDILTFHVNYHIQIHDD